MKKKHKKKKKQSVVSEICSPLTSEVKTKARAFNWRLLLIVVMNTIILFGVYRLLLQFFPQHYALIMGVYLALTAGFVFAYFIYNRGMTRRNITPDMLPDEWSEEQKNAYIMDGVERMQRSKWMLTIIFPLVLTFLFDSIELFWGDTLRRFFS